MSAYILGDFTNMLDDRGGVFVLQIFQFFWFQPTMTHSNAFRARPFLCSTLGPTYQVDPGIRTNGGYVMLYHQGFAQV